MLIAKLYATSIINGRMTLAQVPSSLKDLVRQALNDAGLDDSGKPITE